MMNSEQIKKIFSDKSFVQELMALEDNAAFQAALKEKGLEVTDEQVAVMRKLQAKAATGEITEEQRKQLEDGELPEELLEQVSGGALVGLAWGLGFWFLAGTIICATKEEKPANDGSIHIPNSISAPQTSNKRT